MIKNIGLAAIGAVMLAGCVTNAKQGTTQYNSTAATFTTL